MKLQTKILALLLCLCLTFSMSSCIFVGQMFSTMSDMIEDFTTGEETEDSDEATKGALDYTLTDADHERFTELLSRCETLVLDGTDVKAIEDAIEEMEDQYYHIVTQAQIAYLLYCRDMKDKALSDAQLYASEMQSDTYGEYIEFAKKVDASQSPYRETFFSDWTEADLATMRAYTAEMTELSQANDALLVDYHEFDLSNAEDLAKVEDIYLDFLDNNQKQAQIMEYESYYDYASEMLYLRDATADERAAFRTYVAEYIIPLYMELVSEFNTLYEDLSPADTIRVRNLVMKPYDDQSKDYVEDYVNSYPISVRQKFKSMFDAECSIWENGKNAYDGAYTTYLYDEERPFCYFGPNYQNSFTVVHEMGHYYAGCFYAISDVPLDLAEVHSQANEYLFLCSLKDALSEKAFRVLEINQVLDTLASIILATIIDDFEEYVYNHYDAIVENDTPLDEIMETVCEDYGGLEMLGEQVADMNLYWKYVVLDSPVYYISYALSATVALSIYEIAVEDEDEARAIYRELAEELDITLSFREILSGAELPDPYSQDTFVAIRDCFS